MRDFPRACWKHELKSRLNDIPERQLIAKMNETIAVLRGITEDKAKKMHKLYKNECMEVMVYFGEIDG